MLKIGTSSCKPFSAKSMLLGQPQLNVAAALAAPQERSQTYVTLGQAFRVPGCVILSRAVGEGRSQCELQAAPACLSRIWPAPAQYVLRKERRPWTDQRRHRSCHTRSNRHTPSLSGTVLGFALSQPGCLAPIHALRLQASCSMTNGWSAYSYCELSAESLSPLKLRLRRCLKA